MSVSRHNLNPFVHLSSLPLLTSSLFFLLHLTSSFAAVIVATAEVAT